MEMGLDMSVDTPIKDDILAGAAAIGVYMGFNTRRVFYLIERGELPHFRLGARVYARRSTLRRFIEKLEATHDPAA